jgi:hypothetical protein
MKQNNLIRLIKGLLYFLSVLVLLMPALWLRYPILHGDSGSYINSGLNHFAPVERPVAYGLFLWISSLGYSLWLVAGLQALITVFVIDVFLKRVLNHKYTPIISFATISVLALTTSAGFFVCQIKPDFFLPVIFLSIYAILIGPGKITVTEILLCLIILLGVLTHLSHLPIATGLILVTVIISLINSKLKQSHHLRKYSLLLFLMLSAWVIAPSVNYILTGSFKLSRVSNIFRISRLVQAGVFKEYVDDKCRTDSSFWLCKYQSDIKGYRFYYNFLWDEESFLFYHDCISKGKLNCWLERNDEFGLVVDEIYSSKKYMKMLVSDGISSSFKQFFSFRIPVYASYQRLPYPMKMVQANLPADNYFLERAVQNKKNLDFPFQNMLQLVVEIISFLYIIYVIVRTKRRLYDQKLVLLGFMVLLFLIGNAVFIGFFAGSADRFQSRLVWLVPLYALVLLFHSIEDKHFSKNDFFLE